MRRLFCCLALLLALGVPATVHADDPCSDLTCDSTSVTVTAGGASSSLRGVEDIVVIGGNRGITRHRASAGCDGCEWRFEPACLHGSPADATGDAFCEVAATACGIGGGTLMRVYFRAGRGSAWEVRGQDCLGGSRRAVPVRAITTAVAHHLDSLTLPAPALTVDPPGRAVTGLPVIVAAGAQPTYRASFFAAGVPVDIALDPARWTWTFDAAAPMTTTTPGHRYDGHSPLDGTYYVEHTYATPGTHRVALAVTWTGHYLIRGLADAEPVPERTTTAAREFAVRDAQAVLVG